MNLENSNNPNIKSLYLFLKNIDINGKMELISLLSTTNTSINNEDVFFETFGKLETKESANQLIEGIYKSRKYKAKDIIL